MTRPFVTLALFVAVQAGATALSGPLAAQGPPPASVRVGTVVQEPVQEHRRVTGEVRSRRRGRIASQEEGWVTELLVREGDAVEAGAVLARIDATRLELALAEVEADQGRLDAVLQEREADVERALRDLTSLRDLAKRGAANPKIVADAESDHRVAVARRAQVEREQSVAAARAALYRERIADTEIRAPWSGQVVALETEVGEWLGVGAPVLELVSYEELEVWVLVPQRYYGALAADGATMEIQVDATGESLTATRFRSIRLVDGRARTFQVVAPIEGPPDAPGDGPGDGAGGSSGRARIAPGMSVVAWVPTGEQRQRLLLPRDAVLRNEVGDYVYAVHPGAEGAPPTAGFTPVAVAFAVGTRVVVESPALRAGAQVVVEGNERLFPGAPLAPIGGPPADADRPPGAGDGGAPGGQEARGGQGDGEVSSR